MESIKAQKLQAMKSYKTAQFVYNLIVYSLTALLCCLIYSYLFCFPSTKHFFCVFLPNIYSFILSPKFFFILGNVIVLFLVGESKLSSPATDIYDEYVQRNPSLVQRPRFTSKTTNHVYHKDEKEKENMEQRRNNGTDQAVAKVDACFVEGKLGEEEEEKKLTVLAEEDELNRRVEEFIARVNRQRRLEESQVLDLW